MWQWRGCYWFNGLPPLAGLRFATKAFKFDGGNPFTLSGAIDALDTPFSPCLPPKKSVQIERSFNRTTFDKDFPLRLMS